MHKSDTFVASESWVNAESATLPTFPLKQVVIIVSSWAGVHFATLIKAARALLVLTSCFSMMHICIIICMRHESYWDFWIILAHKGKVPAFFETVLAVSAVREFRLVDLIRTLGLKLKGHTREDIGNETILDQASCAAVQSVFCLLEIFIDLVPSFHHHVMCF